MFIEFSFLCLFLFILFGCVVLPVGISEAKVYSNIPYALPEQKGNILFDIAVTGERELSTVNCL
jgi:hypothetical protein